MLTEAAYVIRMSNLSAPSYLSLALALSLVSCGPSTATEGRKVDYRSDPYAQALFAMVNARGCPRTPQANAKLSQLEASLLRAEAAGEANGHGAYLASGKQHFERTMEEILMAVCIPNPDSAFERARRHIDALRHVVLKPAGTQFPK